MITKKLVGVIIKGSTNVLIKVTERNRVRMWL